MYWKNLDQSGGVSRVSVESLLSLIAEIFRRGILHCCIISGTEKVWIGGGEYQDFWSKFMSHSAEIFCRGILRCCINLGYRKSLEKRGEGVSRFSVKNVLLRVPKNSVGKSFTVASFSSSESLDRRGGVSRFSVGNFMSHSAENFRSGILFCCNTFR